MNLSLDELACELFAIYNSQRSGCDKEIHAEVWSYTNPYEKQAWLNTAQELKILFNPPSRAKKVIE
ncbi:hypothetical protein [Anabaena sp. CCY 9402-a]|uniref:hypothetical protein n=1 Tax=Anabaena sp. CCY 9402-a TaxID=3103867 RepID=UPI0039C68F62